MEFINSYNQTELWRIEWKHRKRIWKEKDIYLPIKIVTAQSRATKKWYTVRFIKIDDVKEFLKENKPILKNKKTISKVKKKKFSWKIKKEL